MPDLLLQPVAWLVLSSPVETVLSSPLGVFVAVPPLVVAAVWTGAGLGASYDRLTVSARHAAVAAALLVAVHVPAGTGVPR